MPYCKAGFKHADLADCDHKIMSQGPGTRTPFTLPEDYYSEEAMAARREENRKKYAPTNRSVTKKINPLVNRPRELADLRIGTREDVF